MMEPSNEGGEIMAKIPSFETICGLLEEKPGAWEQVKPLVKFALMLAPGIVFGSFSTAVDMLNSLGNGVTLSDALDVLEGKLFAKKGIFRKRPNYESPYDRPRLANTLVVYSAWFDSLAEHEAELWENLELDEEGFSWIKQQGEEEYQKVMQLVGGDGRGILLPEGSGIVALEELYILLGDRIRKLAQGLVKTQNLRVNWDVCPKMAVKKYQRYCEILQRYDTYRHWVGQQFLEEILREVHQKTLTNQAGVLRRGADSSLAANNLFRGRELELDQIRNAFQNRKDVVLTGLGGMGKTELAIQFSKDKSNADVYFLTYRGSFQETVARGIIEGIPEYANQKLSMEEAYTVALNRLMACKREDLLILDNVDAPNHGLNEVLRELHGLPMRTLVTTRYEADNAIEVGALFLEELENIFDDYRAPVTREDRLALIEAVDRHTLSVSLIARTLRCGRVKADVILEALKNQSLKETRLPLIDTDYPGVEKQKKLYGHLLAVFRVTEMSPKEKRVMRAAVLLPDGGIGSELFQRALDDEEGEALFSLAQNGWVKWSKDIVAIHPVIRLVCWEELNPTDENCHAFLNAVGKTYDQTKYDHIRFRQIAELYSKAADKLEGFGGVWANRAGQLWFELGDYRRALEYNSRSVSQMEENPDPLLLATAYNNLGMAYGYLGQHEDALVFIQKALKLWEVHLTPDHLSLAVAYSNLGMTHGNLGEFEEELECCVKALAIKKKYYPQDHPSMAKVYNNIGVAYGHLGDYQKDLEYGLKALDIRRDTLSEQHPLLGASYNNVGLAYMNLGDLEKAMEYLTIAKEIRENSLPSLHTDIAQSYNNIGEVYVRLDQFHEALLCQLKALSILENAFSFDTLDLASTYVNIGATYIDLLEYEEAVDYLMKAMKIWEKRSASVSTELASCCGNLGVAYSELQDDENALYYGKKALEIQERIKPIDKMALAAKYHFVGKIYSDMGDYSNALEYMKKAIEIRESVFPLDEPALSASYHNLGMTYGHMGKYDVALDYLVRALSIDEKIFPPFHRNIADSCNNIVVVLLQLGRFEEALKYLQRQLWIAEQSLSEGHPEIENLRNGKEVLERCALLQKKGIDFVNPFLDKAL